MPVLSRGRGGLLVGSPSGSGDPLLVLTAPRTGGVPPGGGLDSLSEEGQAQLVGDITLSEGSGVTLTQVGNDIEIASS